MEFDTVNGVGKETFRVAVIHDDRDRDGKLGVVAFMKFSNKLLNSYILEKAFEMTNSKDAPWYENDGIEKMFDGETCRSTMVGDFVLIGNMKWKCEPTGWKEV